MPVRGLDNRDVLDYSEGPADDIVGLASYSKPRSFVGFDISDCALAIAKRRLALHKFGDHVTERKLVGGSIPLSDSSVDYIHSSGVVHHLENPAEALHEFVLLMRPGARARIMV